jgi:hypothetical protein
MALSEETQVRIVFAPLEEAGKFVRLILGLSTGAVVLFTNLLVSAKVPRWLLAILAASLVAFALSAAMCLFIIFKLLETRALFAKIFTEESEVGAGRFKPLVDSLVESLTVLAARLVLCLGAAILFAATFVIALLFAHNSGV